MNSVCSKDISYITVDEQASAEREVLEGKFIRDGDFFSLLPH